MLECLIIGDSIAVGTQMFYKECQLFGRGGINTWQWNRMYPSVLETANTAIISLGTNDHSGVNTRSELEKARQKIQAKKVYWVLPYGNLEASRVPITTIQRIVREIAAENNDTVLAIEGISADRIHPTGAGYKRIVDQVKSK